MSAGIDPIGDVVGPRRARRALLMTLRPDAFDAPVDVIILLVKRKHALDLGARVYGRRFMSSTPNVASIDTYQFIGLLAMKREMSPSIGYLRPHSPSL
jgi:hypothetical protein